VKKILIIYPHFPPSNLVGVHRIRLFAQHLHSFGWDPTVLTVHPDFYEEKHDYLLTKLLPPNLKVIYSKAFSVTKPRLIGDIGLRSFFQLNKKAKEILKKEKFDFLLCSIPSFYCALLGRLLHSSTGIKYGIDYQDPWVHYFPGSEKVFSRHWFSTKLATFLEPIAVKNASLITGISESYYMPVLQRNPHLQKTITGYMPMGGEQNDFDVVNTLKTKAYLFTKKNNTLTIVYAGAILPKAILPLQNIFKAISENKELYKNVEFHFIGTGKMANNPESFTVKKYAEEFKIWNTIVFEYPARIPYLDVLIHLKEADVIFILGSTESHYTPSKVYQAVLSKKPLLAILHKESSAVGIINKTNIGKVLSFNGEEEVDSISKNFNSVFNTFILFNKTFNSNDIDLKVFEQFSAYNVTSDLANLLNKVV
jgi:hypothetical protein